MAQMLAVNDEEMMVGGGGGDGARKGRKDVIGERTTQGASLNN